ncbi:uncharacterized protein MELLADRAFT_64812 [Melampsora larici-populina 98AG31]|uniref:Uncharacterized protein n=1 Tax=Melampsora larici-populina (strain 98AG31 / pathotype 3-4-7) TaxID=747676 RepID=F4RSW6_MELLP|nr:uncharacterized protein MELLADRAFT_64812 [Melampsora larici-populina 98AG31]EGG04400.1 hypothetical protein MELLADRAFT_64812 [Melampsora larici-populina 98AG31]
MNSSSSQPCVRARILTALKLSNKGNKDLGISSSNFKGSKDYEESAKGSKLDDCDPLLIALARSINTLTSHKYACQRSTKVPIRVPAGFPVNHNFSQRLIYHFEDVKDETAEIEEEDDLALGYEAQTKPKAMKRSQSIIPNSSSPMSGNGDDVLRCPSSTPIRHSSRDKHSKTMVPSVVQSGLSSSSHRQLVGSARTSYLTTPSLTLPSTRRIDKSSGTPSPTTGMIPRLSSKIKQVACLIKPINDREAIQKNGLLPPFDLTAPVRRLNYQPFVFKAMSI